MIAWWWVLIAFSIGASIGYAISGLFAVNTESKPRKWWEDE